MKRVIPVLSQGMLIAGVLLILAGLGWGIRTHLSAPPPPTIRAEGAVVLAVTAPLRAPTRSPEGTVLAASASPTPTPNPATAQQSPATGSTPELLPEWDIAPASEDTQPTRPPQAEQPPTRIVAPAINLDAEVVSMGWDLVTRNKTMVSQWVVPSGAAGWHVNSALPGHGENIVLSGHHNIQGRVFRYVVNLEPGDEITLYVGNSPYVYNVTEKYILKEAGMPLAVRQQNAQWIMPTGDERLTLVTCWPYEWPGNSHRVIVVAKPSDWYLERVGAIH
jgi:sortase A